MSATIHAMNIFVRAVEQNSFVAAARSLLLDPTAVSRSISALEKDLGVLLFVRSTHSLKLTKEGARFYGDCIQILQKYNEATQRYRAGMPYGGLKIGMAPGLRRRVLLRYIPQFQERFPEIEIDLVSVDDRTEIGQKRVDVLIRGRSTRQRGGERAEGQGLIVRKLYELPYVVCASPGYLDRAGTPRIPTDLLRHECIAQISLEHDIATEWHFAKSHVRQKIKLEPKLRIQGIDALCEAGIAASGIIRCSWGSAEDDIRSRKLVPVLPDWHCTGGTELLMIYRKTRPMLPQVSVFVRYLAEAFRHQKSSVENALGISEADNETQKGV